MKKVYYILFFLINWISHAQESFFLKEKDTLYIVYSDSSIDNNVIKHYTDIKASRDSQIFGLNTIYFLLDSTLVTKRNKFYRSREEAYKEGGGAIGASSTCDWCFGLYFVHKTVRTYHIDQSFSEDPFYINFKRQFSEKATKTLKDSLDFDRKVFGMVYYRYNPPVVGLQLSDKELKEKNVFYFDGSTEKYNELLELVKEPHYLFMLEKKWTKQELNSNFNKTEYYIFNEVMYRHRTRSAFPELTRDN